ncbi:MAG: hypothetical protein ACYC6O_08835 [Thermoleophilia bacterium]
MAGGSGRGWRIFGIAVIVAVIAAAIALSAYLIGRGCEKEDSQDKTTTTRTQPAPIPSDVEPDEPAAAGTETEPAGPATETTTTPERYVTGEGEGSTPCIGGFQTTTRTTYWSDGSTDTTSITEPCTP